MKQIVIGANWGDEGKGLVTDALAAQAGPNTLVVRFNGGAQAGHTVTTPEGKRHVFSHMSSGTLAGASTYLSQFFITNPILFNQELDRLGHIYRPTIIVSEYAPVTTFYDMMINHVSEKVFQHGSCGTGIWETVVRDKHPDYRLRYKDLFEPVAKIRQKLRKIKEGWVSYRMNSLLQDPSSWEKDEIFRLVMDDPNLTDRWIEAVGLFIYNTNIESNAELIKNTENVIFEGAQGLQLDQTYGQYPHVTGSYTGIRNAAHFLPVEEKEEFEVIYVTRPYFTRHGNGPLPHELLRDFKPYSRIEDLTNLPDNYRGALRYAYLDLNILTKAILADLSIIQNYPYKFSLAITCLDQLDQDEVFYRSNGIIHAFKIDEFLSVLKTILKPDKIYTSFGPTRTTFKEATVSSLITI